MKNLMKLVTAMIMLSILSCHKNVKQNKTYLIETHIAGFPDSTKIYLKNMNTETLIDSTYLVNDYAKLTGHLPYEPTPLWLYLSTNNGKKRTKDSKFYYTNLLINNEKISIEGNKNDFPHDLRITGSKTHDDYQKFNDLTKSFEKERQQLVMKYVKMDAQEKEKNEKKIWDSIYKIDDTVDYINTQYIKNHANNYATLMGLNWLKESLPKDTLIKIFNKFPKELRQSKHGQVIDTYIHHKNPVAGNQFVDFKAINQQRDTVKFSSYFNNGKYILLDFTSAFCGPCIMSAKELRQINKDNDTIKVVSFSVDANKKSWLYSLKRDTVTWTSLWDGKGRFSDTYTIYGIHGVPTFFIINPEGKILKTWFGYEDGLINETFKKMKNNEK